MKNAGLAGTVLASLLAVTANAADFTLNVQGLRNADGDLWVSIYDDAVAFTKQQDMETAAMVKMPAREGRLSFTLRGLPEGAYAVAVIHDENGNAKLDQEGLEPLEGYGYSNNVGATAVPSFEQAKLQVSGDEVQATIDIIYYR